MSTRRLAANLSVLLVSGVLSLLGLEASYRLYIFGWDALSVAKVNSVHNMGHSGLTQSSPYSEIIYEFRPNLESYFKLVPRRERVKLEDANGELLARFTLDAGRLRVERAPRELAGFVVPAEEGGRGLQILDARGAKLIYQLVREPDGDLRLEDHGHNVLYVLKLREYGFKTVDAGGAVQSRVRVKPEKVSLRDASGRTTLSTRDAIPAPAMACFTLGDLSLEFQMGLALGIIHWGLENP